jgi:hypothetical protein
MRRLVCPVSKARRKAGQSKRRRAICAFLMGRDLDYFDSDSMPLTPVGLSSVAGKDGLLPDLPPMSIGVYQRDSSRVFQNGQKLFHGW